jgi:hypothetical protein
MNLFNHGELFAGLKALAESAFPKHCKNCGRTFQTASDFISETQLINSNQSGLKQSWDDNDVTIVEMYRNCPCGSTLMDFFTDRRDHSAAGLQRREKFGKLVEQLVSHGLTPDGARQELLKILRGQKSEVIEQLRARASSR